MTESFLSKQVFSIPEFDLTYDITTDSLGHESHLIIDDSLAGEVVDVSIKVDGYVEKFQQVSLVSGINTIKFGKLTAGDLNSDSIVNTLDLSVMYTSWFGDGAANYNKDSLVNSLDYWLLFQNFFETN